MDDRKYDEYGNLIGNEEYNSSSSEEDEEEEEEEEGEEEEDKMGDEEDSILKNMEIAVKGTDAPSAIIQYDEKQYYPDSSEIFGDGVETMVEMEDMNPIEKPTISAKKDRIWDVVEETQPETTYSSNYLSHFLSQTSRIRNIAVIGTIHSGKTSLIDNLVSFTHPKYLNKQQMKYTDILFIERNREMSIKSKPITFLLNSTNGKSYACNMIDTPGHINFLDEVSAALRLSDGVLLVVDCVEGMMLTTQKHIDLCLMEEIPMILVLNKLDRLILELRLPPADAYAKLRHMLGIINKYVLNHPLKSGKTKPFSPKHGNVLFGSSEMHYVFSIDSFCSRFYTKSKNNKFVNSKTLSKKLWGNYYFDEESKKFSTKPKDSSSKISFIEFILEPLYKIYSQVVGKEPDELDDFLKKINVFLSKPELRRNVKPLFITVFKKLFSQGFGGLVDGIIKYFPSAENGNLEKIKLNYTGNHSSLPSQFTSPKAPLFVQITKYYHDPYDTAKSEAFGRILGGTIKPGDKIRILGENFDDDDMEDFSEGTVDQIFLYNTRYKIGLSHAYPGNLVLITGISETILKTATLTSTESLSSCFRPLSYISKPVVKVSVEPLKPSELPKLIKGLKSVERAYPALISKAEESGERVLIGYGELYMDCVLHDLRRLYSGIEIKVSSPVVTFRESVSETSSIKCTATTPNSKNQFSMIAQPLEKNLGLAIEQGGISLDYTPLSQRESFLSNFGWDELEVSNLWAFGPGTQGPNCLVNETFPNEVVPDKLDTIKNYVIQGFRWATKEGPLIEEPVRNTKFKLLHSIISDNVVERSSGQIIPSARRVINASILTANPCLLEPWFEVEINCSLEHSSKLIEILQRRRGHIVSNVPKVGTPFYVVKAQVPAMDSFGLETDMRIFTEGQAMLYSCFHHWGVVTGDPLDDTVVLKDLEPSPPLYLAREFLLKTRRRKGLSEEVNLSVYLDEKDREYLKNLKL